MPLGHLPNRATDQGRLCPDACCRDWDTIGGHHGNRWGTDRPETTGRSADILGRGHDRVRRGGIGRQGHHEVLNDVRAVLQILNLTRGQSVDVHPTGHHLDDVLAGQRRFEHHALHIVDRIENGVGHTLFDQLEGIGARPTRGVSGPGQVVADEHLAGDRVGHDEVQVIDQLEAGGRVARRIGPNQREVKGTRGRHLVGGELQAQQLAGSRGEFTRETRQLHNGPIGAGQAHAAIEGARQTGLAPARIVHHRTEIRIVKIGRGARAVNDQCLVGRRLDVPRQSDARAMPELLDLGQQAGHSRGRHAGAGQKPVPRGHRSVEVVKHGVLNRVGVVLVFQFPLGRARRKDLGTRCDHVRLEAAVTAFNTNAHVAAAGEIGHLSVGVGGSTEYQVGGQLGIGARLPELLAAGPDYPAFIVGHHGVGEVALALQRTHGDDVLGVARHGDRPPQTADAVVATLTGVAGREDEEHGLLAGGLGQCIPRGRVVAGRNGVVLVGPRVAPTVVGDEGIGHGRLFLQEGIRDGRTGLEVDGQDEEFGVGGQTAELGIGHRSLGRPLDLEGADAAAGDGAGHVGSVAVGIGQEIGLRSDREDAIGGEVGVGPVDAGVVDIDHHVAAGEPPVRRRVGGIRGAAQQVSRAIIEQLATMGFFDEVHLGRLGQGNQRVRRHIDRDQRAERAALASNLADPERFQTREGVRIGDREHEAITRFERTTVDGTGQQFRFEFEGRMPGRHRGDVHVESQALNRLVGPLHQEGIDRQVRDDLQLLLFQSTPGPGIGLLGELNDVETRLRARHQRLGQRQRFARAGIDQGIAQHQRARIIAQLIQRLGGVASAPGEVDILGGRALAGGERAHGQPFGGSVRGDGQRTPEGRGHVGTGGRRGEPGGRGGRAHGWRLYPTVQPQGTHRQGDGDNQASRRAHDENGITAFNPWSARGGLRPPSAGFG